MANFSASCSASDQPLFPLITEAPQAPEDSGKKGL